VWLNVVSDSLIAVAYTSIPFTLVYFVRRRRDLPFNWMFVCFGAFIIACGATHIMEIWTLWHATYWLSGAVKAITAMASVPTAILLVRLVPKALAFPSPEDLRSANRELRQEVAERKRGEKKVQILNERLEATNKELEAFTYSVSHDLRAPLRHLDGFSKLLLEEHTNEISEEGRRYLARIREGALRMGSLIDDLLNLARVGRKELTPQLAALSSLVTEVLADLKAETQGREVEWKVGTLPFVECDPALMKQVFANLLSNAVKFTRPRPQAVIEVGAKTQDGQPVVFVRDNGVGFSMKYADKLFGVFQRLHRQEDFEGTGVGLATVRRIIQKHGGRIWAEAELDQGATFYFTLGSMENGQQRTAIAIGR